MARDAATTVRLWAEAVDRLIQEAPIRTVAEVVGIAETGHSTPPERAAIRAEARKVVAGWLARDLAALQANAPLLDALRYDAIPALLVFAEGNAGAAAVVKRLRALVARQEAE